VRERSTASAPVPRVRESRRASGACRRCRRTVRRSKTTDDMVPLSTLTTISSEPGTEITTRLTCSARSRSPACPRRHTSGQALAPRRTSSNDAAGHGLRLLVALLPGESLAFFVPTFIMAIVFVFYAGRALRGGSGCGRAAGLASGRPAPSSACGSLTCTTTSSAGGPDVLIGLAAKRRHPRHPVRRAKHEVDGCHRRRGAESARLRFVRSS
jgi:hypothetical protein